MGKRARSEDDEHIEEPPAKRSRTSSPSHISRLSDELVLRVFSYLSDSHLVFCQRLSRKYRNLAGDNQLWRSLYYDRFVRPRASRLPGLKQPESSNDEARFAVKAARWLDEEHLLERGKTHWKSQYKLRHNWSRGSCAMNEIAVAENAPIPPVLVQMHDGVIYMADKPDGVRAWSAGKRQMIAQFPLPDEHLSPPTALAINSDGVSPDGSRVLLGFEDGSFCLLALSRDRKCFSHLYSHPASNGVISAAAVCFPYALTMTATQQLSLYVFEKLRDSETANPDLRLDAPRLLHSLKSHTVLPPFATSLRVSESIISICIAYAVPTYLSGWTVGVQEVKLSSEGRMISSRTASAIDQHYRPLAFSTAPTMHHITAFAAGSARELRHIHSKPTSLSYSHPYLLVSHPDNTLTLYLVTSTAESLFISPGSRLWGHTSAVSGAHIGGRGKAVSVSRRGDELRIWELEGGFGSTAAKKRLADGQLSVQIRPESEASPPRSGIELVSNPKHSLTSSRAINDVDDDAAELTLTRGWIGFDEENVVVLKERPQGAQTLVVYDFT